MNNFKRLLFMPRMSLKPINGIIQKRKEISINIRGQVHGKSDGGAKVADISHDMDVPYQTSNYNH